MAKRGRTTCSKCSDQHSSIDRISMLPDELLVFVLSFLTLKEATATSILSRRWRYLWTFIPKLDFDGREILSTKVKPIGSNSELVLDTERWNYIRWVDHVIASHKDSTIEEFKVVFNLTKPYQKYIDKWLRYALARKVQRLELILIWDGSRKSREYQECYTFPDQLLCMKQSNSIDFKHLRKMIMHCVNVNGEALEFFLCNCPFLEHLSVSQSGELSTLKITGPFPSFKRLEISLCHNLNSLVICDANISYLKYMGRKIHFCLENVPLLVEICIGGLLTDCMEDVLSMFSSYLPQLEAFAIVKMFKFSWEETAMFYSAVKMRSLKQLVVIIRGIRDDSLLPLTNLIRASPCLQRFVLEVTNLKSQVERKVEKITRPYESYRHLKEVEFVGYRGVTSEIELVEHFLDNAIALEKILIDPCEGESPWNYSKNKYFKEEMVARTRAQKQLVDKVPSRINLKIL